MHVLDAIEKAEEKMQERKDFFLCSCFVSLRDFSPVDEWTVIFYSPKSGNVMECTCTEDDISMEESKAMKEAVPLRKSEIRKDEEYVIRIIQDDFGKKPLNILISLHTKENNTVWTVSVVTQDLNVTTYDINSKDGSTIRKETTGLVRRV